jgi:hypothetical protein
LSQCHHEGRHGQDDAPREALLRQQFIDKPESFAASRDEQVLRGAKSGERRILCERMRCLHGDDETFREQ